MALFALVDASRRSWFERQASIRGLSEQHVGDCAHASPCAQSKSQAVCLHGYDIDGDGRPELITGWSNGKVGSRQARASGG